MVLMVKRGRLRDEDPDGEINMVVFVTGVHDSLW